MKWISFKGEISAGEVVTFLSILGSAFSLVLSWSADRRIRIQESEDKVRLEAAVILGKVQRARATYLSMYSELQSDVVEVTQVMAETGNPVKARDFVYRSLQTRNVEMERRIYNEHLETAYVGLLPFDPIIDSLYTTTMSRLKNLSQNQFRLLVREVERIVLLIEPKEAAETAVFGNKLRALLADVRSTHEQQLEKGAEPLEAHLKELIDK
jgi:hypothetical protein